jgi:hypothetical protein
MIPADAAVDDRVTPVKLLSTICISVAEGSPSCTTTILTVVGLVVVVTDDVVDVVDTFVTLWNTSGDGLLVK